MKLLKQILSSPLVWAFVGTAGLVAILQAIFGHPYGAIGFVGLPGIVGVLYLIKKLKKKKP